MGDEIQGISHRFVDVGGVRLHCAEAGSGPLVVLLHGFPEFWYSWRCQLPALAAAGYHAVAPDLRGYDLSDKPKGLAAYHVDALAGDIAGLVDALGERRATVVGHDWGAGVAWVFAMQHPDKLDRLAIINGPHPERMMKGLLGFPQILRSWYMFLFQIPALPERLIAAGDFALLRRTLTTATKRPGAMTDAAVQRYVEAVKQPGALTAMINYYRAMPRSFASLRFTRIDAPVMVIWGDEDPFLERELATPKSALVPNARIEHIPDAGHFAHYDRPERVNELLIDFLAEGRRAQPSMRSST